MDDASNVIEIVKGALYANSGLLSEQAAAALIFRSTRRLRALVLENTGLSYREFRTRIRLECARRLLSETALSVPAISERLGYSARDKLEKVFKRYLGMTPAFYRANQKCLTPPEKRPLRA